MNIIADTIKILRHNEDLTDDWYSRFDEEGYDGFHNLIYDVDAWTIEQNTDINPNDIREFCDMEGWIDDEKWDSAKKLTTFNMIHESDTLSNHGYIMCVLSDKDEVVGLTVNVD